MKHLITLLFLLICTPLWAEEFECIGDFYWGDINETDYNTIGTLEIKDEKDFTIADGNGGFYSEYKKVIWIRFSGYWECSSWELLDGKVEHPAFHYVRSKMIDNILTVSCLENTHKGDGVRRLYRFNKNNNDFLMVKNFGKDVYPNKGPFNIKFTGKCY